MVGSPNSTVFLSRSSRSKRMVHFSWLVAGVVLSIWKLNFLSLVEFITSIRTLKARTTFLVEPLGICFLHFVTKGMAGECISFPEKCRNKRLFDKPCCRRRSCNRVSPRGLITQPALL